MSDSVFEHWWQRSGEWVEAPNRRRGGESGVQLLAPQESGSAWLYSKRQTGHLYRSLLHPFGQPTILREAAAYRALARLGVGAPRLQFAAARKRAGQWQALLITEALEGYISLDQWYASPRDPLQNHSMLRELATTLARMHLGRWQHGCCYAKHIFIRPGYREGASGGLRIAVLDLEKSRRRWRVVDAARHDMRQLSRHRGAMPETHWQQLQVLHEQACSALSTRSGFSAYHPTSLAIDLDD